MCTNQREIVNKYTGHRLYVKCGHCPACLQEKAAYRVSRIKAQNSDSTETYMHLHALHKVHTHFDR